MSKKERLSRIVKEEEKSVVKKVIQKILMRNHDAFKVSMVLTNVMNENFDDLKEDEIDEILNQLQKDPSPELENDFCLDNIKIQESETTGEVVLEAANKEIKLRDERIFILESQIKEMERLVNITFNKTLVEVSDEDINMLYIKYKTERKEFYKDAFIVVRNSMVLIPKSYYNI